MKKKFLSTLKTIIDWLTALYNRNNIKEISSYTFQSLSPTDEAENIDYYIETLDWALQNRHKIKNIAVAGPYGSGKSSVIKTFQKRNRNAEYHFLNISLATFKEEIEEKEKEKENKGKPSNDILRLIELSILQQLFYHEEDCKIPDSRFKKIKHNKRWLLYLITIGFITFITSLINLFYPEFFYIFLKIKKTDNLQLWIHYSSVIFALIGFSFILFKLIGIFKGFAIRKLNINNAEIEISEKVSKSILNKHIDEILYFFEVTNYNVVIIEDLDRFQQTEVFTKLREINLLINYSKKVKKDVVFIYAIRDDIFKNYDRTKFFDFMIPIIPVINSSNSNERLLRIVNKNQYKISNDLIDDISLFIDDMRLLYNIMNEYHIYSKILNKSLVQDKLLSMITYKNIYPNDFTDLSNGKGVLFNVLQRNKEFIKSEFDEIEHEISQMKSRLSELITAKVKDIKELRTIYLAKIIEGINLSGHSFTSFWINKRNYSLSQATEDDVFDYFQNYNTVQYYYQNSNIANHSFDFSDIEEKINEDFSYKEREKLIHDIEDGRLEFLKNKIEDLEEKKNNIKKSSIKDLIANRKIKIEENNNKQNELINILMRNGYIDEDYIDYISIFYEGSLSKADYQFLINVKTQKNTDFEYKLFKIDRLIDKINLYDFDKEYILNFSLVDYLISSEKYKEKRKHLFNQLKNESSSSIKFIESFIENTAKIEIFIKLLCESWLNIWGFIKNETKYQEKTIANYYNLIFEHAKVEDIKLIFSNYKNDISENASFLNINKNEDKIKKIVKSLDLKFEEIEENSPEKLIEFVYLDNHYEINPNMLKVILNHKEKFDQIDFEQQNYTVITNSGLDTLIKYVKDNINKYLESVYFELENNTDDTLDSILELLNNESILFENKEKLIVQIETKIEDIDKIEDSEIIKLLFENSKINPNWSNIVNAYTLFENEFSKELVAFVNNEDNAKELSTMKIPTEEPDVDTVKDFIKSILLNENINDDCYNYLLKSVPYIYSSLDFTNLSSTKVGLLIDNNKLIVNSTNILLAKENFDLHIKLIESNFNKFISDVGSIEFDEDDIESILESKEILLENKVKFIDYLVSQDFNFKISLLSLIGNLILNNINFYVSSILIKRIITESDISDRDKIRLFILNANSFDKSDVDQILSSFENEYYKIAIKGKRPVLKDSNLNRRLLRVLYEKDYISNYSIEKKGLRISTYRK